MSYSLSLRASVWGLDMLTQCVLMVLGSSFSVLIWTQPQKSKIASRFYYLVHGDQLGFVTKMMVLSLSISCNSKLDSRLTQ